MLKNLLILVISLMALGGLSAQSFIGKINPGPNINVSALADDTVKILAVMVNFLEDRDGATFGNGKFGSIYSQNYGNDILDPLPHDRVYFESHLSFVKNYFQKISNGKVDVQFTILPDTFSVTKTMRNYSPTPGSDDFTPMGQFAEEVWTKADELNPGLVFSDYNLFVIFHAGVGRDISLPGSLGNERDLPSVYLGENSLKNIFGSTFEGFPVSNGAFKIKNSMIIPETESRELETISGKFLFEITINGLIVASVASHLGLPDLFDTNTGLSAIGRFGLMDGQSIFAYNGCFPPEPSAWEKIYLGWADAVEISPGNYDINIVSKLAATLADTVILKVLINSSEYYLIENRQRDVLANGSQVTIKSNGNIFIRNFSKDTTGFYSYDTDSLSGVVIDVDEFDWALPGNGIVIWHIDENVINQKLAENKINTDKTRRGVDVEEADGVQDIGEQFTTIFGDVVIGEGTDEDFWYADNKAELFKDIFNKNSRPDTKTNTGANSLITIKDFSSISNRMTFKIEYGDSIIKPLFSQKISNDGVGSHITSISNGNNLKFALQVQDSLFITNGLEVLQKINDFSLYKVASVLYQTKNVIIGVKDTYNTTNRYRITYWYEVGDSSYFGEVSTDKLLATSPVIRKTLTEDYEVIVGTYDGKIIIYNLSSILDGSGTEKNNISFNNAGRIFSISTDGTNISGVYFSSDPNDSNAYYFSNSDILEIGSLTYPNLKSTKDINGNFISIISDAYNKYLIISNNKLIQEFSLDQSDYYSSFAIGDLKNDGNNYITLTNKNKLEALNLILSQADNFPYIIKDTSYFIGQPLTADFEGDPRSEIISFTNDGRVFAFDGGTGKIVDGFPISVGEQLSADACLFVSDDKLGLAVLTSSGVFYGWFISSIFSDFGWAESFGDKTNSNFIKGASNTNTINEFSPTSRAYNYPNPVYNGETAIRYFVGEDSKINIKIFDLAGDFVAELNADAQGGLDNETVWNVNNIQSGVYLARIEALGSSGKSESIVIKIAVVK